jgi:hypothetical protein
MPRVESTGRDVRDASSTRGEAVTRRMLVAAVAGCATVATPAVTGVADKAAPAGATVALAGWGGAAVVVGAGGG